MEWNLKLTGCLLVLVSIMHMGFSTRFNWKEELAQLTLINRQMMIVHTFFIALTTFLMGLLCIFWSKQLVESPFGRIIASGLFVFWLIRLVFQFFVYSPRLWRGKRFETGMHYLFSLIWTYITIVFFVTAFGLTRLPPGVAAAAQSLDTRISRPWEGEPQRIPGRIQCEWYDEGGEGVAYHTANIDGALSISVDGKDISGSIKVPTTHREADAMAWRQWHYRKNAEVIADITYSRRRHLLTLHSISGNMNYDFLEFTEGK